jgi:hypothetical protein
VTSVRSHFLQYSKAVILGLYELEEMAADTRQKRVESLLEGDYFLYHIDPVTESVLSLSCRYFSGTSKKANTVHRNATSLL